jgi:cobalt-zinc-cadmium resistance protein CzcA
MIQKLVAGVLQAPAIVMILSLVVLASGLYSYKQLDIEAYPNPVAPMIEIITQPEGLSAEEVERAVTIPIENGLAGMIDLDHIRSQSLFGLSDVKCYFNWNPDYYAAQQRVLNRLQFIQLPNGLQPQLSPWNAIGEIYRYRLKGEGYTLADLKTAQDWILEKQFKQVPGVIDVVSFGGATKQYQVQVDPVALRGHNVTLQQLTQSIANANQNAGGGRLPIGEQSFNVRSTGLIKTLRDIEAIVVGSQKGTPMRVRDLAQVVEGAAPRLGIVGKDQEPDIVEGIVLMRYGGDSIKTIEAVHQRVEFIRKNHLLPPGMELVPFYDRERLVHLTTHTVIENLLVGMLLVTLVLWAFLGHTRAALITAVNIPLALMIAFFGMVSTGTPANLISLGAVDFGIVVDSTVIMMENIFRHLGLEKGSSKLERIAHAAAEVGSPMFFSTLIIGVAFIPLFTMTGVAGVIFSPMAHTYAFAIGGAILMALTLTPVLASKLLGKVTAHDEDEASNPLMRALDAFYRPLFRFALRQRGLAVAIVVVPVVLVLGAGTLLGREFMPKLEEGNFWIRATFPLSISLEQSSKYVGRMRAIMLGCAGEGTGCDLAHRGHPEIEAAVTQLGRPDDGTDTAGFSNIEIFAPLAPRDAWRKGVTKETLQDDLQNQFAKDFPGVVFNFSQVIADNVEEAMSGVKGENTVKVFGPDLVVNEKKAQEIMDALGGLKGIEDLGVFRSLGQPNIRITPDREKCGRYGLNVGDVEAVVSAAIGGQAVTQVYQGEKHFDLVVRWSARYRQDIAAIRSILVSTPDGAQVPLSQVSAIVEEEGPSMVYREDFTRYAPVKFSVRGRDLASTIGEAQQRIKDRVKLPYDTHLEWSGEINQLNEATGRLTLIIPLTLLLIAFLVYSSVKNWKDLLIVLGGIPVACAGGVGALLVTRTNFSISAAMGFISIFGIAIQDSLIVVNYAQQLWREGLGLEEGARLAAERRLRPVLMTTCVAMLGLIPAAVSTGIGSETQKPLALVVIGGALVLALLPRLLQPALLVLAHQGERRGLASPTDSGQSPAGGH